MECCVEFITLISSEANDISEKEAKKTIACEHVERALRDLGFGDYIPDVLAVAEDHKEQLKVGYARKEAENRSANGCGSHGRRNRVRWSRAGFPRRNCFGSSRSCFGLRRKNIMLDRRVNDCLMA